jgi:hypothetical protein
LESGRGKTEGERRECSNVRWWGRRRWRKKEEFKKGKREKREEEKKKKREYEGIMMKTLF